MFFGHIGVGLAAKRAAPKASLGFLLVAVTAIDTLAGLFAVIGIEHGGPDASFPWSHGLFMSVVWSIAGFAVAFAFSRDARTSIVIGLLVFSHWVLDFISHPMGMGHPAPPDLPLLFDGSPKVGLGLYNSMAAALITEFGMLGAGIVIYLLGTKAKDRTGVLSFWLMVAFLALFPLSALLPPQLSILMCFATLLLLPFGIWIDAHRSVVTADTAGRAAPTA